MCCTQHAKKFGKLSSGHRTGKCQFSFQSQKGKESSNFHTVALISHASKVMIKILQTRLQEYVNQELAVLKVGFRKDRETRDQIANTHWIIEKAEDGRGIGRGDHFLPHKFIKRSFERWTNSTKQLLNAGIGHQAPRKAVHCLWKGVGQSIKDKKRDKELGTETHSRKGDMKEEKFPNTRKPSLAGLWGYLESQRAT